MAVNLKKGQKVSLTKEAPAGLSEVVVALGWDEASAEKKGLFAKKPQPIDCDATAIMLKGGKLTGGNSDIIYYGNLMHISGAVKHMGDNLTGAGTGDDEQIVVNLPAVPQEYDKIVFIVNIYQADKRGQHFGMIKNAYIRVFEMKNGNELCRFNLSENYDTLTAMIFGELYHKDGEWKFNAVGDGTHDVSIAQLAKKLQ